MDRLISISTNLNTFCEKHKNWDSLLFGFCEDADTGDGCRWRESQGDIEPDDGDEEREKEWQPHANHEAAVRLGEDTRLMGAQTGMFESIVSKRGSLEESIDG